MLTPPDMLATAVGGAALGWPDYGVLLLYLLGVGALGVWVTHRRGGTEDYLLAGRAIPWWAAGISYLVSLFSTISMVAIPGEAYNHGATLAIQALLTPVFALVTFFVFVRFYFRSGAFTPFDYLERRFDASLRAMAAGFYLLMRVVYMGMVLYASSIIFEATSAWPRPVSILVLGIVATGYTCVGGLRAVVWTDVIQFLILAAGLLFIIVRIGSTVPDGLPGVIMYAAHQDHLMPDLDDPAFYSISPYVRLTLWSVVLSLLNDLLFYNSSDQIAIQRFISTSGYREARRSIITYAVLILPVLLALWFVGLAIYAYYGQMPPHQRPARGDAALYRFIADELPSPLPGLIVASLMAAMMSTLDSGLNSLATVATKDIFQRFFRPAASEETQVRFSRVVTVLTGTISIGAGVALSRLSDHTGGSIIETSLMCLSLSVALPPVFLLGVLSRRATAFHARFTLIAGWLITAVMLIWYLHSQNTDRPISFMYVFLPALIACPLIGFLLAAWSPRRPADAIDGLTLWTLRVQCHDPVLAHAGAGAESSGAMSGSQHVVDT